MRTHYNDEDVVLLTGDARKAAGFLGDGKVQSIVTSPPYFGLRDYDNDDQIGLEHDYRDYVHQLVLAFAALEPALANDGTLWVNLGDAYVNRRASAKYEASSAKSTLRGPTQQVSLGNLPINRKFDIAEKNLFGIPWRFALAMQEAGWILRNDIIWHKTNGLPEPVKDRFTRRHEHVFLFSKQPRYFFNPAERTNPGDVWVIPKSTFSGAHFATMPAALARRCITAGSRVDDVILDPFSGSSTTGMAALSLGRKYIGIDINSEYHDLALRTRLRKVQP